MSGDYNVENTMLEYEKLRLNPRKYGSEMTMDDAVELLEMLLPKSDVNELRESTKKDVMNGKLNTEQIQLWVHQYRLWKALDSFLERVKYKEKN